MSKQQPSSQYLNLVTPSSSNSHDMDTPCLDISCDIGLRSLHSIASPINSKENNYKLEESVLNPILIHSNNSIDYAQCTSNSLLSQNDHFLFDFESAYIDHSSETLSYIEKLPIVFDINFNPFTNIQKKTLNIYDKNIILCSFCN